MMAFNNKLLLTLAATPAKIQSTRLQQIFDKPKPDTPKQEGMSMVVTVHFTQQAVIESEVCQGLLLPP